MARQREQTKPQALTRRQAADQLGCGVDVVDDMVRDGRLRVVTVGQRPRITQRSIDALLDAAS